jgi:RHS repeat-associated protein
MELPGRHFAAATSYRYGFNGKEKDDEINPEGDGDSYDYGMRIYNPRLSKFMSVDPIFRKYPELSTYQFASDRPIDGIDVDGLEYATFTITVIKATGVVMDISVAKDYELKDKDTKGPGIKYVYVFLDKDGNELPSTSKSEFKKNFYGIYAGPNNPQLPEEGMDYTKVKDNYDLAPIDEIDQQYKTHDLDFDNASNESGKDLRGLKGTMKKETTPANEKNIKAMKKIIDKAKEGKSDALTGRPYSKDGIGFAKKATFGFEVAEKLKKLIPKHKEKDSGTKAVDTKEKK